jgi:hypothetical protein
VLSSQAHQSAARPGGRLEEPVAAQERRLHPIGPGQEHVRGLRRGGCLRSRLRSRRREDVQRVATGVPRCESGSHRPGDRAVRDPLRELPSTADLGEGRTLPVSLRLSCARAASSTGRASGFRKGAPVRETAGTSAAICWDPLRALGTAPRAVTIRGIGQSAGNPVREALRGHTLPALTSSRG